MATGYGLGLLLSLCSIALTFTYAHSNYLYKDQENIHVTPIPDTYKEEGVIESEGTAFFKDCTKASEEAIANMKVRLKTDEQVYNLEWYDFYEEKYFSTAICKRYKVTGYTIVKIRGAKVSPAGR